MLKALLALPPDILDHILNYVGSDNHVVILVDGKYVVLIKK
jgi:hypothetical protein